MESFKPSAPSMAQRILSNPLLHLFLAFILVCVVIIFVRLHSKEEIANRVQFLKGGPTLVSRGNGLTGLAKTTNLPPPPPPGPSSQQMPPPPTSPSHLPAMALASGAEKNESLDEGKKGFGDSVRMHLSFAEVDHQIMESLRQESRSTGQFTEFGDFKAGAIPSGKKATSERGVRILQKADEKLDREHMSASANIGEAKTDGSFLGVTYSVLLTQIDGNTIRGEIEVLQNFHESTDLNDPPVRRTYPSTTFELTTGQSWMVSLNLPSFPQEEPDSASAEGIMRIFQSPQYKSKQTEFTLFFEFDRPAVNQNAGKNSQ